MPIKPLNRRAFLQGVGVTLTLPFLEAMLPMNKSWAAAPVRFGTAYLGNGMLTGQNGTGTAFDYWSCQGSASGITSMSAPVAKLAAYKDYMTVVQNCGFNFLTINSGAAAHESASPSFLTGQMPMAANGVKPPTAGPTDVTQLSAPGMSLDRLIASKRSSRLKSLMMAVGPMNARFTIYDVTKQMMGNLSWDSQTAHLQNEMLYTASDAFKKLTQSGLTATASTGTTTPAVDPRIAQKVSVIDGVLGDINTLNARLGPADKAVMDQYLTSLRKIETDLQASQAPAATPMPGLVCTPPNATKQASYNEDATLNYNHITQTARNMIEMMALSFQCGLTDVATLMLSYDATMVPAGQLNAAYGISNSVADVLHGVSHYVPANVDPNALAIYQQFQDWHTIQVAYLAQLLKAATDSDGRNILDNSVVLFGGGMGDPATHTFDGLMRIILGKGAGLNPGANGKLINAGGGNAHPKLLQTISNAFGITAPIGMSNSQTIAGIFG